jgi:hypothetical protein
MTLFWITRSTNIIRRNIQHEKQLRFPLRRNYYFSQEAHLTFLHKRHLTFFYKNACSFHNKRLESTLILNDFIIGFRLPIFFHTRGILVHTANPVVLLWIAVGDFANICPPTSWIPVPLRGARRLYLVSFFVRFRSVVSFSQVVPFVSQECVFRYCGLAASIIPMLRLPLLCFLSQTGYWGRCGSLADWTS